MEVKVISVFTLFEYIFTNLLSFSYCFFFVAKLKYFYSSIFDILGIFMNFDDISIVNHIINSLLKRWSAITSNKLETIYSFLLILSLSLSLFKII